MPPGMRIAVPGGSICAVPGIPIGFMPPMAVPGPRFICTPAIGRRTCVSVRSLACQLAANCVNYQRQRAGAPGAIPISGGCISCWGIIEL
jgi:hypothetical protein